MSTNREQASVKAVLKDCEYPVIVDLGAHRGEDSLWMMDYMASIAKRPRIVMVEPDIRNLRWIQYRDWKSKSDATVIEGAIAQETGTCDFHVCDNEEGQAFGSGSIRKPTGHLVHFPWCKFPRTIGVRCFSLDDLFKRERLTHIDMLWADLQGAEKDMILGGAEALRRTRYLFIEAEEVEFYEGQALRPELLRMLPDWVVEQTFDYNLLLRNTLFA